MWKDTERTPFVFLETDRVSDRRHPSRCQPALRALDRVRWHWGSSWHSLPSLLQPRSSLLLPSGGVLCLPCSQCNLRSPFHLKSQQKTFISSVCPQSPTARDRLLSEHCQPWSLLVPAPAAHTHLAGNEHPSMGQQAQGQPCPSQASGAWSTGSLCFSV